MSVFVSLPLLSFLLFIVVDSLLDLFSTLVISDMSDAEAKPTEAPAAPKVCHATKPPQSNDLQFRHSVAGGRRGGLEAGAQG
jgi:hypothetical protein